MEPRLSVIIIMCSFTSFLSPLTTPSFSDLQENSHNLAYSPTCSYDLLSQRDIKQNQQREEAQELKPRTNQVQASKKCLLAESHEMCLMAPRMSCDNTCEVLSAREAHDRPRAQGFCHVGPSAYHIPESQTLREKAGVQHEPCCLHAQFRHC